MIDYFKTLLKKNLIISAKGKSSYKRLMEIDLQYSVQGTYFESQ